MVLVVALHNLPKPCTDFTRAMMLPLFKLCLDEIELRDHPHLRRSAPNVKGSAACEIATKMCEPQKREGLGFSLATLLSVSDGEPAVRIEIIMVATNTVRSTLPLRVRGSVVDGRNADNPCAVHVVNNSASPPPARAVSTFSTIS